MHMLCAAALIGVAAQRACHATWPPAAALRLSAHAQERALAALSHLIVSSYHDLDDDSAGATRRSIFFLRRQHPAAVAFACLATTLILSKDVVESMPRLHDRMQLLKDVADMLDIGETIEDPDLMLCPVDEQQKAPFLQAMKFLATLVWEMQDLAETEQHATG